MTTEIEKLLSEVEGFDTSIDSQVLELKRRQDARTETLSKLNEARCRVILRDIDEIVNAVLELQEPFQALKQKVIEVQASDSAWWKIPKELGEPSVYTEICNSELRTDKVKSLDLLTFLQKVRTYSQSEPDPLFKFDK